MEKIFLLADDDVDDTLLFCEALGEIDPSITCYCAMDGKKLLELLQTTELKKLHAIFLDINMPGMNGWECLVELKGKEEYKHIPVLIYSTSSHQKEAGLALKMGALCFFTKPTYFNELKEILEVVAINLNGNLMEAFDHFNVIKAKNIFVFTKQKEKAG